MSDLDDIAQSWNQKAQEWDIQVGDGGDRNRILNSDPVLWRFAGSVEGQSVLDAGCGTGYLTRQLAKAGAMVTGIDIAPQMLDIARHKSQAEQLDIDFRQDSCSQLDIDFRQDSCSQLKTLPDAHFELLISNYVIMDLPDLDGAIRAFYRVLKPGGVAVLVFSHPCFPQGDAATVHDDGTVTYRWKESYFEPQQRQDLPWKHFTSPFVWFHRSLSDYWKAFTGAGFAVVDFEEPRLTQDRLTEAKSDRELFNCQTRPFSVAFKLLKPESEDKPDPRRSKKSDF